MEYGRVFLRDIISKVSFPVSSVVNNNSSPGLKRKIRIK
jgi:hypothetical protein